LFARSDEELDERRELLQESGFEILTEKLLDGQVPAVARSDALREGVQLFNEERYWESHEVLEHVWRMSKGVEREVLQSVILTAAAFVHYQKGESDISLSILRRARSKMNWEPRIEQFELKSLRSHVDEILESGDVQPFKLRIGHR
jgi:predicted metal-dependent hydrolase